jgi:hypothetical protein
LLSNVVGETPLFHGDIVISSCAIVQRIRRIASTDEFVAASIGTVHAATVHHVSRNGNPSGA